MSKVEIEEKKLNSWRPVYNPTKKIIKNFKAQSI
jgi:hypothetical protein